MAIAKAENINIDPVAVEDIIKLSDGDMRKVINTLQNIHISLMSHIGQDKFLTRVTRDFIYKMTGYPHPEILQKILEVMLSGASLKDTIETVNKIKLEKGISLGTLISNLGESLMSLIMPAQMKGFLLKRMADIEYRLSLGCDEDIQTASLVAGFMETRFVNY